MGTFVVRTGFSYRKLDLTVFALAYQDITDFYFHGYHLLSRLKKLLPHIHSAGSFKGFVLDKMLIMSTKSTINEAFSPLLSFLNQEELNPHLVQHKVPATAKPIPAMPFRNGSTMRKET
jgi:hypothetical protein